MAIQTTPQEYRVTDPHALVVTAAGGGVPVFEVDTLTRAVKIAGRLLVNGEAGDVVTHTAFDTGVHGAGGDVLATDADIATHAGLTDEHHTKYLDSEAISAVEGEATLVLGGTVTINGINLVNRTRKVPMSILVAPNTTQDGGTIQWSNNETQNLRATIPIPSDWVAGTDITLNVMVYKTGSGTETAVMQSWIASHSDGETFTATWNIEDTASVNQSVPASSELHTISRTITAADVSAGEAITWLLRRLGGDGSDTLDEALILRYGPWIEYTAFF